MAALRKGAVYLRFVSSGSVLLSSRKPAVSKLGKWRNILYTGVASLAVGGGLCAVPFKQVEPLSHDSLIKRAASLATDSSSTFLSQTSLALIDAITEYAKAVHTLIALQKRYLDSLGKLTPAEEDSVWQVIIGQRAKVNDRQEDCKHFESTWFSAMKLCEAAAEAAYTSGVFRNSISNLYSVTVGENFNPQQGTACIIFLPTELQAKLNSTALRIWRVARAV
uniref:Direct IAP-binding protein with low pI n=1 Tax=Astatotilapia calliptera TaxID=8154 RepID=A0A3P8NWY8_ASTCA